MMLFSLLRMNHTQGDSCLKHFFLIIDVEVLQYVLSMNSRFCHGYSRLDFQHWELLLKQKLNCHHFQTVWSSCCTLHETMLLYLESVSIQEVHFHFQGHISCSRDVLSCIWNSNPLALVSHHITLSSRDITFDIWLEH